MLHINFINDLTLKTIHDLLIDCETNELTLQEELDFAVDLNYLFELAHYLKELNPDLIITYKTSRDSFPMDFISAEMSLRPIPFNYLDLNGNICANLNSLPL